MSQAALDLVRAVRAAALELKVECSWCDVPKVCKNADHLYAHIMMRHDLPWLEESA